MKKIFVVIIVLFATKQCFSQQPKSKIHFNSINSIGTVIGENGSSTILQTINGIKINNNWAFGLGIGHDPYQEASIPVFVDVRKYMGNKTWQPFIYVDGGMNYTLRTNNYPKKWSTGKDEYTFKPSFYGDAGIGISKSISRTAKFFISAGYSVKQFKYDYQNYWIWDTGFPTVPTRYNFNFERWSFKLGLEL